MKLENALAELQASLDEMISIWLEGQVIGGGGPTERMGFIDDNCVRLMAKAAIAVMEASADVQDYPRADGQLEDI